MKKTITLCWSLVFVMALVGCSNTTGSGEPVTGGIDYLNTEKNISIETKERTQQAVTDDEKYDLIPMVMVNGELYLDTRHESTVDARCGVMDGEITSTVDGTEQPTENNQSNFGTGYEYQYGSQEGLIEIYMNEKWRVFATEKVLSSSELMILPEDSDANDLLYREYQSGEHFFAGVAHVAESDVLSLVSNPVKIMVLYNDELFSEIDFTNTDMTIEMPKDGNYCFLAANEENEIIDITSIVRVEAVIPEGNGVVPLNETNEESENNRSAASSTMKDIPVDEETYQEAREYSEELTELQNRISEAMMNKELPFVISSSIYENPDRILVRVNTTDEDLIAKLRTFDTTGKLLQIEYTEHTAVLDK